MKVKNKRGIRIQTRIIVSALLVLAQIAFLFVSVYYITLGSVWLYTLSSFLGIVTVVVIINRRSNPDHKIAWLVFILVFPIFGVSLFLLWGGGRIPPHLRKKMLKCESHYLSRLPDDSAVRNRLKYYDLIHSRQADFLVGESGYPVFDGSSTEYLAPGEKFFEKLLDELKLAEKYIFIEFFILAEGVMWDEIHEILKEKAEQGVEVKIMFDDFGSIKRQHKGFIKKLKAENITVSLFNPITPTLNIFLNNRNHRKIVVIDGKTAFTGGVNIGDEYINEIERFGYWMDCALMVKGRAVQSFLAMFCSMWEFTTGKQIDFDSHLSDYVADDDSFVIPYSDDPLNDNNPAEGIYMQILNTAQKYVYIISPYLIIDNAMKSMIKMAAKSGIDIKIITPHIPDKGYVHAVTQYNYLELMESGVKIYEYLPGFIHSKLFISDDKVATVGTINMDYRSFVFHFECGAWLCDNSTVLNIRDHFNSILDSCEEIKIENWKKRPLREKFKQAILHIFAPFM